MKELSIVCKEIVCDSVEPKLNSFSVDNAQFKTPAKQKIPTDGYPQPPRSNDSSSLDTQQVIYFSPTINKQIPILSKSTIKENLEGRFFIPHKPRRYSMNDAAIKSDQISYRKDNLRMSSNANNVKLKSLSSPNFLSSGYFKSNELVESCGVSSSSNNIVANESEYIMRMNLSSELLSHENTPLNKKSLSKLCESELKGSLTSEIKMLCPPTITESDAELE